MRERERERTSGMAACEAGLIKSKETAKKRKENTPTHTARRQ